VTSASNLTGKKILVVDDEPDILATVKDILEMAQIDTAKDYEQASAKIKSSVYDLAVLDIMGVNGLALLDACVEKGIPAVMLTAHAVSPEMLMTSIQKGAIGYFPKEVLADLDTMLENLFGTWQRGEPTWKLLFETLGDHFNERFGPQWKEKDKEFWSEFSRTYHVAKGIRERILHDPKVLEKGI
jgi:CheY-like chemotaxis protein